jgi:hypothetical protein
MSNQSAGFAPLAYSVADACRFAAIGKTRLDQLISEGRIEARQCGRRTLILADSPRAFVASLPPAPIRVSERQNNKRWS